MTASFRYIVWVAFLFVAQELSAQTEGVITYEITVNNHRTIPAEQEGMKAMIPQFQIFKQQLYFDTTESIYKPFIEEEDEETNSRGRRYRMNTLNYTNLSTSLYLTQISILGKKYLVTDTLKTPPWKFGKGTKTIQGYECMQAFYTISENNRPQMITAWYAPGLPPNLGPEKYNTLPGAVLAVDVNNAERVIVAKKIEIRPLAKNELVTEPSGGQRITREEFRKIMQEQRNQRPGRFKN
ncbi:MAG: GLPGLI family protein [Bacteroidetes bacterium]|nr:GLPGLI family protein [Bacteroidota bacterium]